MAIPPETWELATPVFGVRYPKPDAPAVKLPDAFSHIGIDLENALIADGGAPPGTHVYHAGTDAERIAAPPTLDLVWVVTDVDGFPQYLGTGTEWIDLTVPTGTGGGGTGTAVTPEWVEYRPTADQSIAAGGAASAWLGAPTGTVALVTRDAAGKVFTLPKAGLWRIELKISVDVALNATLLSRLQINGAPDTNTAVYVAGNSDRAPTAWGAHHVTVAANTTIQFWISSAAASTVYSWSQIRFTYLGTSAGYGTAASYYNGRIPQGSHPTGTGWVQVTLNSVDASGIPYTATQVTIAEAGMYFVAAHARVGVVASTLAVQVTRNGAGADINPVVYGLNTNQQNMHPNALVKCAAGDVLRLFIYPSNQPVETGIPGTGMDIHRITIPPSAGTGSAIVTPANPVVLDPLYRYAQSWQPLKFEIHDGARVHVQGAVEVTQGVSFAGGTEYKMGTIAASLRPAKAAYVSIGFAPQMGFGYVLVHPSGNFMFNASISYTQATGNVIMGVNFWYDLI